MDWNAEAHNGTFGAANTNITTIRQFYVQVTEGSEQRAAERYETLMAAVGIVELGESSDTTDAQVTPEPVEP